MVMQIEYKGLKAAIFLFGIFCLITSCISGHNKPTNNEYQIVNSEEITSEQQTALEALNSLQMEMRSQRLYSTFPGIQHDCLPFDSSFVVSSAELLVTLKVLLSKYDTDMSQDRRNSLLGKAVVAQEEYVVEQCFETSIQIVDGTLRNVRTTVPRSGTWILPNILGRRDLILVW